MIDGRFDQHFLELFAREHSYANPAPNVRWRLFVAALVAVFATGAILFMK
jgi:hypothetical protein